MHSEEPKKPAKAKYAEKSPPKSREIKPAKISREKARQTFREKPAKISF